jgi:hypothetical protein
MHEHLIREAGTVEVLHDKVFLMDDADKAAQELADFRDHGGGGLLMHNDRLRADITSIAISPEKVPKFPHRTNGFHKSEFYLPTHWVYDYSIEEMVPLLWQIFMKGSKLMITTNGCQTQRRQAGVLKCATVTRW